MPKNARTPTPQPASQSNTLVKRLKPKQTPKAATGSCDEAAAHREAECPQNASDDRDTAAKGHGAKSEAVREQAILALLSERTTSDAAQRAGVNERTLRRWLTEDEAFKADYETARRATFQAGMSRIHALTSRAVSTLEDLLDAKDYPSVRLGAARTVAEIAIHQQDAETIMRKLEEIENVQRQRRG